MNEIIDLYAKMVIATFGFMGPAFTLLISIFIEALEKSRILHQQKLDTINSLISENLKDPKIKIERELKLSLNELKKLRKENQTELNLLNPKRQIKRVFLPLIISLIMIILILFEKSPNCPVYYESYFKIVLISISVFFFSYCLFVLWQILNMIISAKKTLYKEKADQVIEPMKN